MTWMLKKGVGFRSSLKLVLNILISSFSALSVGFQEEIICKGNFCVSQGLPVFLWEKLLKVLHCNKRKVFYCWLQRNKDPRRWQCRCVCQPRRGHSKNFEGYAWSLEPGARNLIDVRSFSLTQESLWKIIGEGIQPSARLDFLLIKQVGTRSIGAHSRVPISRAHC